MSTKKESPRSIKSYGAYAFLATVGLCAAGAAYTGIPALTSISYDGLASSTVALLAPEKKLDTREYDLRLLKLAHVATSSPWHAAYLAGTTTASTTEPRPLWPKRAAYPKYGALLPANRIVAYYGNFYSKQMGILGEFEEDVVLEKLRAQVAEWEAADPSTPVIPAIEYIDVTAQGAPGKDGKYRLRMPDSQIDKALAMAKKINAIVILDIQVGLSSVEEELPLLRDYLALPNVHLAIDPEFDMQGNTPPGRVIGTTDAATVNRAAEYLAELVRIHDLPPKILLLHRFTEDMLTDTHLIKPLPEVQIIVQMDGWGSPQRKKNTYRVVITPEPIQFTGFKVFYKNDLKEDPPRLMTPQEILELTPSPSFIQYQ
jgi:hypothetical protein